MTKKILFFLMIAGIAFTSCKKDEKVTPFNAGYSDLSVEENKKSIEDNGIALVQEFDQMKSATAIEVAIYFDSLNSKEETEDDVIPMEMIASLGKSNTQDAFNELKAVMEDPLSLIEMWNGITAKYTWNFVDEQWDSSGSSDAIIFEFPGKEGDTENTAIVTINNFKTVTITDPAYDMEESVEPEFPTNLNMELKYNGTTLSTFSYKAAFASTGVPTSSEVTLTVDAFSMSAKATHSPYSKASITYSFKDADKVLVEMNVNASGNWSEENLDNTLNQDEVIFEDIISNSNAYIQIMNVKFAGKVDVKSIAPIYRDLEAKLNSEEITDEEFNIQTAEAYNKYSTFVSVYADNNEKISEGEFFADSDDNGNYEISIRFVFSDGSKVSAQEYYKTSCNDLIEKMNAFILDFNEEYGTEYETLQAAND